MINITHILFSIYTFFSKHYHISTDKLIKKIGRKVSSKKKHKIKITKTKNKKEIF